MNIFSIITYLIYIIFWESLVLGGGVYLIFFKGHSGWWIIIVLMLSAAAYKPQSWNQLISIPETSNQQQEKVK